MDWYMDKGEIFSYFNQIFLTNTIDGVQESEKIGPFSKKYSPSTWLWKMLVKNPLKLTLSLIFSMQVGLIDEIVFNRPNS